MKKIVVTIPAYNEEKTIAIVIKDIHSEMKKKAYNYKIIVVDDGSTDNTAKIAKKSGAKVFSHQTNMGLAETFRTEIDRCLDMKADMIVHTDADGQYRADEIHKLIKEIDKGYDLVLGSRFSGKIETMPFMKRLGNKAFSKVLSKLTKLKITDGQTGFRAFTKEVAENIKIISTHTYTQEQIIRASRQRYRIKEVPIHFDRRIEGESKLMSGPFQYAFRAWLNIFRIHRDFDPLKFFGSIGLFFIGIFTIFAVYLAAILMTQGINSLETKLPTILVSMIFFLTGLQIILFGFMADRNNST